MADLTKTGGMVDIRAVEILSKLIKSINSIMGNLREIQLGNTSSPAGISSGMLGIMREIITLNGIARETNHSYSLTANLTTLLNVILKTCFLDEYINRIPAGKADYEYLYGEEARALLVSIQTEAPFSKDSICQVERIMRALSRLFTIGGLGDLAKKLSYPTYHFLMLSDSQLGKAEYVLTGRAK
ncbi:MAG: hypothetical protein KKD92_14010 [Proteobacteria bacterium]|nr:hypothetical protein [Pseudomonadota bacterium]